MAAAPRKRKRITPTLLAPGGASTDGPAPAAPAVAAPDAQPGAPELEAVAKAVEQLQPLKVPPHEGWLIALEPFGMPMCRMCIYVMHSHG